jgi:glc operon protein GlcG
MRNRPTLTAADVQKMVAACKSEANKNKWNVSIAVVDDAGYPLISSGSTGPGR